MNADDVDALYEVPPGEFVAARDELARRLRAAGDRDGAARVKALRRPTTPAWALNLVTRDDPDVVRATLDLGDRLRAAQAAALAGQGADALRNVAEERRGVVRRAVAAARAAGARAGHDLTPAHAGAIAETVEAALVEAEIAAQWSAGRLTQAERPAGFGFGAELADVAPAPSAAAPASKRGVRETAARKTAARETAARKTAAQAPAPQQTPPVRAAARRSAARSATKAAADRAAAAQAAVEKAGELRRAATAARDEVERLRTAAEQADRAARAARQALRAAQTAAARAELFASTAEQAAWEAGERARGS